MSPAIPEETRHDESSKQPPAFPPITDDDVDNLFQQLIQTTSAPLDRPVVAADASKAARRPTQVSLAGDSTFLETGDAIMLRIARALFAATLGFGLVSVEPGRAVFDVTPAEYHYNSIGSVHGGVYATLCDSACGCAVHSMLPAGAYYTSLDLATRFIRPVTTGSGRLLCEGTVTHLGSRTALAEARLTDASGKLYAHATSNCLIFREGG